jgi:hypothetical protein
MGALSTVNLGENKIQFSNELCMALLRCAIDSQCGLRIQVEEGNDFSAVNKHTMEFILLGMFAKEDIPREVDVESAGLTGITRLLSSLPPLLKTLIVCVLNNVFCQVQFVGTSSLILSSIME